MFTIRIRCSVNRWLAKKLLHFQGLQNVNRLFIKLFEKISYFLNLGNELCSIAINLNNTFSLQSLTNNYYLCVELIMKIGICYFHFQFLFIVIHVNNTKWKSIISNYVQSTLLLACYTCHTFNHVLFIKPIERDNDVVM